MHGCEWTNPSGSDSNTGSRPYAALKQLALLLVTLLAAQATAQERPSRAGSNRQILLRVPRAEEVWVEPNVVYKQDEGSPALHLDIYYPPDFAQDTSLPVVVFMNGGGFRDFKDFPGYESWARATAASGMAAVTFESLPGQIEADVEDLMVYLAGHAATLGIDADNMCWWACADSVARTLPLALQEDRKYLRCAVVYYGMSEYSLMGDTRPDLPIFLVKAGNDSQIINARIDRFVQKASASNRDLTYVIYASGRCAFDIFDDTVRTRAIIQDTLDFMKLHLSPAVQAEVEETALIREANAARKSRDWTAMATAYEKIVQRQPENGEAHFQLGYAQLALGSLDESIASFERTIELGCSVPSASYNIGCGYARKGGAGDKDQAFAWLHRALDAGFSDHILLKDDPDLANLRGDERFSLVLKKCATNRRN